MEGSSTASAASCTFPAEIYNMIIDYLHEDKESLISCAIVCKAWVNTSRSHLFATFKSSPKKSTCAALARFFNGSPDVVCYIRKLVLRNYVNINLDDLLKLLIPLTEVHLRVLQLINTRLASLGNTTWTCPPLTHCHLRILHISLRGFSQVDIDNIYRIIGLFNRVGALEINISGIVEVGDAPGSYMGGATPNIVVGRLRVSCLPATTLFNLVATSNMGPHLAAFDLTPLIGGWDDVVRIGDTIRATPNIERFYFVLLGPEARLSPPNGTWSTSACLFDAHDDTVR